MKKFFGAEILKGYCPVCIVAAGARAGACWARRQAQGRCAGRAGWPWAVHSVHSACFWPGSTRYFPESKFLDIVREPGS